MPCDRLRFNEDIFDSLMRRYFHIEEPFIVDPVLLDLSDNSVAKEALRDHPCVRTVSFATIKRARADGVITAAGASPSRPEFFSDTGIC